MATKVMQQPWLWKRFTSDAIETYLGSPGEPIIDLRGAAPQLKICDGATLGGVPVSHEVEFAGIATPTIVDPLESQTGVAVQPIIKGSQFNGIASDGSDAVHVASYWEVARDFNFTDYVYQSGRDTTSLVELDMSQTNVKLERLTTYYVRVRYEDEAGVASEWSLISSFEVEINRPDKFGGKQYEPINAAGGHRYGHVLVSKNGQVMATSRVYAQLAEDRELMPMYIHRRVNGEWVYSDVINPPAGVLPGDGALYLKAISSDGSRVIAWGRFANTNDGRLYVFDYDAAGWSLSATLDPPEAGHGGALGTSLNLSDDGTVLSASEYYYRDVNGLSVGRINMYRDVNGTLTYSESVYSEYVEDRRLFGQPHVMSPDGGMLVCGWHSSYFTDPDRPVEVYTYQNGAWNKIQEILSPYTTGDNDWGEPISISGDGNVICISTFRTPTLENQGAVHVYVLNNGLWEFFQTIELPILPSGYYKHGHCISYDGSVIAASGYVDTVDNFILTAIRNSDGWNLTDVMDHATSHRGGADTLSSDGGTLYMAATTDGDVAVDAGAVYIYN